MKKSKVKSGKSKPRPQKVKEKKDFRWPNHHRQANCHTYRFVQAPVWHVTRWSTSFQKWFRSPYHTLLYRTGTITPKDLSIYKCFCVKRKQFLIQYGTRFPLYKSYRSAVQNKLNLVITSAVFGYYNWSGPCRLESVTQISDDYFSHQT
jgi:hypothetical protein